MSFLPVENWRREGVRVSNLLKERVRKKYYYHCATPTNWCVLAA
jgi:hypothetical protein